MLDGKIKPPPPAKKEKEKRKVYFFRIERNSTHILCFCSKNGGCTRSRFYLSTKPFPQSSLFLQNAECTNVRSINNLIYIWVYNYETHWLTSPNLFLTNLICPYSVPNRSMNPTFLLFLFNCDFNPHHKSQLVGL